MKKLAIKKELLEKCLYQFFNKSIFSSLSFEYEKKIYSYFSLFILNSEIQGGALLFYPRKDSILEKAFANERNISLLLYKEEKNYNNIEYCTIQGKGSSFDYANIDAFKNLSRFVFQLTPLFGFEIEKKLENCNILNINMENLTYNINGLLKEGYEGILLSIKD